MVEFTGARSPQFDWTVLTKQGLFRVSTDTFEKADDGSDEYKKSGVMLMQLTPKAERQTTVFEDIDANYRRARLNEAMDRINAKFGRRTVTLAGARIDRRWAMRAENRTPAYTTRWDEFPTVW